MKVEVAVLVSRCLWSLWTYSNFESELAEELGSCVKVKMAVLVSPSLMVLVTMWSLWTKQH